MTLAESPETDSATDDLATMIGEDAPEFETLCRLTPRVSDAIAGHPIMRMLIPKELGGSELGVLAWFRAAKDISRLDPSAGWVAAQNSASISLLALNAEPEFRRELLSHPTANASTSVPTTMRVKSADAENLEVEGSWQFCSGVTTARFVAGVVIAEEGAIEQRAGLPYLVLEPNDGEVVENWNPVGLRGTGSHDFVVQRRVVPRERIVWLLGGDAGPQWHPYCAIGNSAITITLASAAVQVGVARKALDLARSYLLARTQVPISPDPLIDEPTLFDELAVVEAEWQMANAAVEMSCLNIDQAMDAAAGTREAKLVARQVGILTVQRCAEIVTAAFRLGGSEASTRGSALERCFRDGNVLNTHTASRSRGLPGALRVEMDRARGMDAFAL